MIDILDVEDLNQVWGDHSAVFATTEGEAEVSFTTWYVNGVNWPTCDFPRDITLSRSRDIWPAQFQRLWNDRLTPGAVLRITVIHPPVKPSSGGGHLLLHQQFGREPRGVLVSTGMMILRFCGDGKLCSC